MGNMSYAQKVQRRMGSGPLSPSEQLAMSNIDEAGTGRVHGLPLTAARKLADWKTVLAATPGSSEFGLAATLGSPLVGTATIGSGTATATENAVWSFQLPPDYNGGPITVRVRSKVTVARTVSALIDVVVKKIADGAAGADICETAAQSINSTSYADKDFVITPTGLAAGDMLNIQVNGAANDTGGSVSGVLHVAAVSVILG